MLPYVFFSPRLCPFSICRPLALNPVFSPISQLAIYDPEGLDPQTDTTYQEVKVSLQDNITTTRKTIQRSWTTLKVCTIWSLPIATVSVYAHYLCLSSQGESRRVFEDTRKNLTNVVGKARKQADGN